MLLLPYSLIVLKSATWLFGGHCVGKSFLLEGLTLEELTDSSTHVEYCSPYHAHSPQYSTGGSSLDIPHS